MAVSNPVLNGAAGLSGLRTAYVVSVVALVALALATLVSPLLLPVLRREQATLPEAGKVQVLAKENEWVLQYNLLNGSNEADTYALELTSSTLGLSSLAADRRLHASNVLVGAGRTYVFIYHLRPAQAPDGIVRFTVRRSGDAAPIEDLSLHLPPSGAAR